MAAVDLFSTYRSGLDSPIKHVVAVVPNDSTDLVNATRGLYIGVSGDVKLDTAGGETALVFKSVPVGILPVRATRVYNIGTTATNILALR